MAASRDSIAEEAEIMTLLSRMRGFRRDLRRKEKEGSLTSAKEFAFAVCDGLGSLAADAKATSRSLVKHFEQHKAVAQIIRLDASSGNYVANSRSTGSSPRASIKSSESSSADKGEAKDDGRDTFESGGDGMEETQVIVPTLERTPLPLSRSIGLATFLLSQFDSDSDSKSAIGTDTKIISAPCLPFLKEILSNAPFPTFVKLQQMAAEKSPADSSGVYLAAVLMYLQRTLASAVEEHKRLCLIRLSLLKMHKVSEESHRRVMQQTALARLREACGGDAALLECRPVIVEQSSAEPHAFNILTTAAQSSEALRFSEQRLMPAIRDSAVDVEAESRTLTCSVGVYPLPTGGCVHSSEAFSRAHYACVVAMRGAGGVTQLFEGADFDSREIVAKARPKRKRAAARKREQLEKEKAEASESELPTFDDLDFRAQCFYDMVAKVGVRRPQFGCKLMERLRDVEGDRFVNWQNAEDGGNSTLMLAIQLGAVRLVQQMLQLRWDPSLRRADGSTTLIVALKSGCSELLVLSIAKRTPKHALATVNNLGQSAIAIARKMRMNRVVRCLATLLQRSKDAPIEKEPVASKDSAVVEETQETAVVVETEAALEPTEAVETAVALETAATVETTETVEKESAAATVHSPIQEL